MLKYNIEAEDSLTFRHFMCFEWSHCKLTCISQPETQPRSLLDCN